ncbi:MAG: aspartate carbamoyltransferase catalytic subunit [Polyangiaceae bacterium]|nr:aspartate carbamoyltransferase catalytic subunit [Polyangiaceae bacterium]
MTAATLRHLLGTRDLSCERAESIFETADAFLEVTRRPIKKVPTLRGKTVINLFFEASTRTRTSFELAGKRLGADVVNMSLSSSSTSKGETLRDTVATLDAMHPDVIVVRHNASGAAHYLAERTRAAVVNAGDGMHEHPTQALLDAFSIRGKRGSLKGLKIAICGDIAHSRVARSNALLFPTLGAEVRLAGPRTLLPRFVDALGCKSYDRLEPAIEGADVVMMLRIQQERLGGASFSTLREYSRVFGLTVDRLNLAAPDALVMHPGPMNRGVEIADDVADCDRSLVLDQVEAGVAIRMAVLYMTAAEAGADLHAT